jgi:hypothetical protein
MQQIVHERTMYAPIWQLAFINGHGPRVGESGFGLIPRFAYTGPYEDIAIKIDAAADTRRTAAQPPLQQIERASAGLCAFGGGSSPTVASGRRRNRDLKWRERPVLP